MGEQWVKHGETWVKDGGSTKNYNMQFFVAYAKGSR